MQNKNDLGRAMNDLTKSIFFRHNGILVERSGSGFKVGDKYYPTLEDMNKGMDEVRKIIYKSIRKP